MPLITRSLPFPLHRALLKHRLSLPRRRSRVLIRVIRPLSSISLGGTLDISLRRRCFLSITAVNISASISRDSFHRALIHHRSTHPRLRGSLLPGSLRSAPLVLRWGLQLRSAATRWLPRFRHRSRRPLLPRQLRLFRPWTRPRLQRLRATPRPRPSQRLQRQELHLKGRWSPPRRIWVGMALRRALRRWTWPREIFLCLYIHGLCALLSFPCSVCYFIDTIASQC